MTDSLRKSLLTRLSEWGITDVEIVEEAPDRFYFVAPPGFEEKLAELVKKEILREWALYQNHGPSAFRSLRQNRAMRSMQLVLHDESSWKSTRTSSTRTTVLVPPSFTESST